MRFKFLNCRAINPPLVNGGHWFELSGRPPIIFGHTGTDATFCTQVTRDIILKEFLTRLTPLNLCAITMASEYFTHVNGASHWGQSTWDKWSRHSQNYAPRLFLMDAPFGANQVCRCNLQAKRMIQTMSHRGYWRGLATARCLARARHLYHSTLYDGSLRAWYSSGKRKAATHNSSVSINSYVAYRSCFLGFPTLKSDD